MVLCGVTSWEVPAARPRGSTTGQRRVRVVPWLRRPVLSCCAGRPSQHDTLPASGPGQRGKVRGVSGRPAGQCGVCVTGPCLVPPRGRYELLGGNDALSGLAAWEGLVSFWVGVRVLPVERRVDFGESHRALLTARLVVVSNARVGFVRCDNLYGFDGGHRRVDGSHVRG